MKEIEHRPFARVQYLLKQNEDGTMDRVLVFVATRYSSGHVSRKLRRYDIAAAELHEN
jgi:superfamily II DNA/RNA helicase